MRSQRVQVKGEAGPCWGETGGGGRDGAHRSESRSEGGRGEWGREEGRAIGSSGEGEEARRSGLEHARAEAKEQCATLDAPSDSFLANRRYSPTGELAGDSGGATDNHNANALIRNATQ